MSLSSTFLLFIVGVGILQGVFLAFLLVFHPKSERTVNKFLALYILGYCIPMMTPVVQHFFSWQLLALIDPILLLLGPFLYLYVCSFKEKITFRKAWPHFLLFLIIIGYDIHLYLVFSDQYPSSSQIPPEVPKLPSSMARVFVRIGQMTTYFFLASRALTSYQRSIQHLFSETSKINLAWVRWLINGYIVLLLIMISLYLLILRNPENFGLIILINTAIVTPYLYAVAYRGLTQPTLWQVRHEMIKDNRHNKTQEVDDIDELIHSVEPKNQKAGVNQERIEDIASGVTALMKESKLYLQSELTLQDLADKLDIPAYQVTQAINEGLRKNFYDLVNGYRVDEAKRLLQDPVSRNSKILSVGMDAGFNSKTTFNTVFKKPDKSIPD